MTDPYVRNRRPASAGATPHVPRRILVAARGQDDDRVVLEYAARLARCLDAELILVAIAPVVPAPTTSIGQFATVDLRAQREAQEFADRVARERVDELAAGLGELTSQTALAWGGPGPATVAAAAEHAADLVVVPMRERHHALGHALHDHADRYVLHHTGLPVLVVPTSSPPD